MKTKLYLNVLQEGNARSIIQTKEGHIMMLDNDFVSYINKIIEGVNNK